MEYYSTVQCKFVSMHVLYPGKRGVGGAVYHCTTWYIVVDESIVRFLLSSSEHDHTMVRLANGQVCLVPLSRFHTSRTTSWNTSAITHHLAPWTLAIANTFVFESVGTIWTFCCIVLRLSCGDRCCDRVLLVIDWSCDVILAWCEILASV